MFEDIGGKIKVLAKILCWINIIGFVICGIVMFANSSDAYSDVRSTYVILGFVFMFIGPLVAWASSCLIYGFGELIETNSEIAENIHKYNQNPNASINTEGTANANDNIERFLSTPTNGTIDVADHSWRGNCDTCNAQNVLIKKVSMSDEKGTRNRYVCEKCAEIIINSEK